MLEVICSCHTCSLDVTEQGHSSHNPVVRVSCPGRRGWCAQTDCCDVGKVSAPRLLVNRTEVQLGVPQVVGGVDGIQVDHREGSEEYLGRRLHQTAALTVPPSTIQVEPMYIDTLWWRLGDILFHHPCHVIVQEYRVQCPATMGPCYFLTHGCQEALRVEEASHPEDIGPSLKDPGKELAITLQQFSEPEAKCR